MLDNWVVLHYGVGMNKSPKSELELKFTAAQVQRVEHWRELDAQIKKLTDERDAIAGELQTEAERRHAEICTYRGKVIARMQESNRSTFDIKRFRIDAPAVAAAYMKKSEAGKKLKYVA